MASCGTALTNTQVRALKRHSERIVVNFDPDTAGANATERVHPDVARRRDCRCACSNWSGDLDPDEYVKHAGAGCLPPAVSKKPGVFSLAGRPRAQEVRHATPWKGGWMPSSSWLPPSSASRTVWSALRSPTMWPITWEWTRSWCATISAKEAASVQAPQDVPRCRQSSGCCCNALLASEIARTQVIPQLRGVRQLDGYVSGTFSGFVCNACGWPCFSFSDLEGRLVGSRPGPIVVRRFCR